MEKWTIQTEGGADSLPSRPGLRRTGKRHAKPESTLCIPFEPGLVIRGSEERRLSPAFLHPPGSFTPPWDCWLGPGRIGDGRAALHVRPRSLALGFFRCSSSVSNSGRGGTSGREGRVLGGAWAWARGGGAEGGGGGRGSRSVGLAAAEGLRAARRLGAAGADAGSEADAWRWRLWRYARERERARACWPPFWDGAPRPPLCPLLV